MTKIAFLGLGRMGLPMAGNLAADGYELTVWNRSPAKAEDFAAQHRARAAATPYDAVSGADVVITMLADDRAVLDAYTGEGGALEAMSEGTLAFDMGTVSPDTVGRLRSLLGGRGVDFVDAPVSGSVTAAAARSLTIMAAGDADAVHRGREVLSSLGDPVLYLGESGAGSAMKLVVNTIVHSLNQAVSEALVLAERAGIERSTAYSVFLNSAVSAPFMQYRREAFERPGEVPVAFRLELAAKDLRLALELADKVGAELPQARVNREVLGAAMAAGFGDADESAVAQYLRSGTPPP
ncbi:3-hydroxyisobutyrate dehydrogenase [Acrocarpospora pleiomorpha]|uniref:3-hydroxyisobutyrate dehydrogenase n=1 Tax=Acrocarpospora pleiomorpha TaxID=90975 RepID=A0A5M3XKY1_9ACTN|nr:NAD(P)-dependent oxidoreductase [Acrocarpospora pleiomorpha]GES21542.1 3-hydroxyisobutyrate dehydrogenase [Acrocarpospora pleiomorpha]